MVDIYKYIVISGG